MVGDQTVYTAILSPEDTEAAARLCLASPYVDHVRINGESLDVTTNPAIPVGELEYGHYHRLTDQALLPSLYQPSTKIAICSDHPEKVAELFKGDPRYAYMISRNTGLQGHKLAHPKATKSAALNCVAASLGVSMDEVIAFGDDIADVDMLAACGHGVAMGNATPEARAAADAVCLSNNRDGVARYLADLLALS
jgi:hydroxymethylpyrimidine pyrophosphatase-like HAD family hydrolase